MRLNSLFCLVFGIGLVFVASSASYAEERPTTNIVAKVNGVPIAKETLDTVIDNIIKQREAFGRPVEEAEKETIKKNILDQLIAMELIYQTSQKVDLGDLKPEIETQFNNLKNSFASEEEFNKALSERNVNLEALKKDIDRSVYINALLNKEVFAGISASDEEAIKEYENNKQAFNVPEQVRASHILIKVEQGAAVEKKGEARKKIEALRKKAVSGEDFAVLARENSEDNSKISGGDLGYFSRGQMVLPFEEAAFKLNKDEISPVVETQFGYHIIKLADKTPARTLSFDEVKENLKGFLQDRHKGEALDKYIEELKKTAKIELF